MYFRMQYLLKGGLLKSRLYQYNIVNRRLFSIQSLNYNINSNLKNKIKLNPHDIKNKDGGTQVEDEDDYDSDIDIPEIENINDNDTDKTSLNSIYSSILSNNVKSKINEKNDNIKSTINKDNKYDIDDTENIIEKSQVQTTGSSTRIILERTGEMTELEKEVLEMTEAHFGIKIDPTKCYIRGNRIRFVDPNDKDMYIDYVVEQLSRNFLLKYVRSKPELVKSLLQDYFVNGNKLNREAESFKPFRRFSGGDIMSLMLMQSKMERYISKMDYIKIAKRVLEFCELGYTKDTNYYMNYFPEDPSKSYTSLYFYLFDTAGPSSVMAWKYLVAEYSNESEKKFLNGRNKTVTFKTFKNIAKRFITAATKDDFDEISFFTKQYRSKSKDYISPTPENDMLYLKAYKNHGCKFIDYTQYFPGISLNYLATVFFDRIWPRYIMKKLPESQMNDDEDRKILKELIEKKVSVRDCLINHLNHREMVWVKQAYKEIRLEKVFADAKTRAKENKYLIPEDKQEEFKDIIRRRKVLKIPKETIIVLGVDAKNQYLRSNGDLKSIQSYILNKHSLKDKDKYFEFIKKTNDEPAKKIAPLRMGKNITIEPQNIPIFVISRYSPKIYNIMAKYLNTDERIWFTSRVIRLFIGVLRYGNDFEKISNEYFNPNKIPEILSDSDTERCIPLSPQIFQPVLLMGKYLQATHKLMYAYIPRKTVLTLFLYDIESDFKRIESMEDRINILYNSGMSPIFLSDNTDFEKKSEFWDNLFDSKKNGADVKQINSEIRVNSSIVKEEPKELKMLSNTENKDEFDIELIKVPTSNDLDNIVKGLKNVNYNHYKKLSKDYNLLLPNNKILLVRKNDNLLNVLYKIYEECGYFDKYEDLMKLMVKTKIGNDNSLPIISHKLSSKFKLGIFRRKDKTSPFARFKREMQEKYFTVK